MVSLLHSTADGAPPSKELLPGARWAQFKVYHEATDALPTTPASTVVHGDCPPEPTQEHTSLLGITQLLEWLMTQVDNSQIAQAESSADWE
jgi:hypothetical protein